MSEITRTHCGHAGASTAVCTHVFTKKSVAGVEHFTGEGVQTEYLCAQCAEQSEASPARCYVCADCVEALERDQSWPYAGKPGILRRPRAFRFSRRTLRINSLADGKVLAFAALNNHASAAVVFTEKRQLWLIDTLSGAAELINTYTEAMLARAGSIQLTLSRDNQLIAITSCVHRDQDGPSNRGIVAQMSNGHVLMVLDNGNYHTELTPFPVAFVDHQNKTWVIHATDWNRLDITEPFSGQCLTTRVFSKNTDDDEDEELSVHTEWNGELRVSPNQKRIATIGWFWHPLGLAYAWDLQAWLTKNVWEADKGHSKKLFAVWDYFWDAPFFWIDDETLCIWGYEQWHTDNDMPLNSAALYDATTGDIKTFFAGPTQDVFHFDQYLFSGTEQGDGISIWSLEDGALLHEEKDIQARHYHPGAKTFLVFKEHGVIVLQAWREGR